MHIVGFLWLLTATSSANVILPNRIYWLGTITRANTKATHHIDVSALTPKKFYKVNLSFPAVSLISEVSATYAIANETLSPPLLTRRERFWITTNDAVLASWRGPSFFTDAEGRVHAAPIGSQAPLVTGVGDLRRIEMELSFVRGVKGARATVMASSLPYALVLEEAALGGPHQVLVYLVAACILSVCIAGVAARCIFNRKIALLFAGSTAGPLEYARLTHE
eukprot:Polyplicarium_translucidae@DN2294_c0_g1_i1.p1